MTGFQIAAANIHATTPALQDKYAKARKKKMCLRCQKEKNTKGGHISMKPGFFKFICADCVAEKARRDKDQA